MPKICVNHLDHYYELIGEGAPLVFIHGAFADANAWEPQWQRFSASYRLVRYDLRGHGRTGPSALSQYTIATFADDLAALLDALEIQVPIICGQSMGGVIAQAFAVRSPQRPKALILASAPVSASLTLAEKLLRYALMPRWAALLAIRALGVKRFTRFSLRLARVLWGPNFLGQGAAVQEYVERCMLAMDSGEYLKLWGAIYSFDLLPLEQIACPTLVLNGANEAKGPLRHTAELLRRVPQVKAGIVPEASHAMNLENPQAFNQVVEEFISSLILDV